MRVLVTGAPGFIGSHVVRRLARDGDEVVAVCLPGVDRSRLADVAAGVRLAELDLRDRDGVAALARDARVDACIHLAWTAEPGVYLHTPENTEHVAIGIGLANALADSGCRRFVGIGTNLEYDLEAGWLQEDSPLRPAHLYGACKLALSVALEEIARRKGLSVAWARTFYLYGPAEDPRRLVPAVITAVLRGEAAKTTPGEQVRDYLHVEDVASAYVAIARSALTGAVNVGSGVPIAVRDVVAKIGALAGRPDLLAIGALPYRGNDPMFVCADVRKLKSTGWAPAYDLDSGLHHTIEWWRARARVPA
jgi:nucleoside-diphosphate-sugar epimerase